MKIVMLCIFTSVCIITALSGCVVTQRAIPATSRSSADPVPPPKRSSTDPVLPVDANEDGVINMIDVFELMKKCNDYFEKNILPHLERAGIEYDF